LGTVVVEYLKPSSEKNEGKAMAKDTSDVQTNSKPETVRWLITALVLPLGLWLIQFVLQRVLGP